MHFFTMSATKARVQINSQKGDDLEMKLNETQELLTPILGSKRENILWGFGENWRGKNFVLLCV